MKRFTKMFSFILAVAVIIGLFPITVSNAAEKKYKLSLTGEYDLDDSTKTSYQYAKVLKNVKLDKVEGKNQWNLTMYAGTAVDLPISVTESTKRVEVTTKSEYVYGDYVDWRGVLWVEAEDNGQTKKLTNKVLTCKSYDKSGKCLSTLKIVVTILPHNAKLERKTPATVEELYKIGYRRTEYSDFAWDNVIAKYPEYLGYLASIYAEGYDCPETFGKEMQKIVNVATTTGYIEPTQEELSLVTDILNSLSLDQYDTDWEKVLEIQKWVKANIKYKVVDDQSIQKMLKRGYGDCGSYTQFMITTCQMLDIPCYSVETHDFYNHAWNIVLVDGLWCTMDLTDQYVGFGVVDCKDFTGKPNLVAYEELQPVFGGKAYLLDGDDLPDEVNRVIDLYNFQLGGHRKLLLDQYREWLEEEYDPTVYKDNTFKYWFREYHLTKRHGKDDYIFYDMWFKDEYDPEVHKGDPLEYWCLNVSKTQCDCYSLLLEEFPDELDVMEKEAAQWRK